ncbi:hypothetical protein POSPLADRAFT_1181516 [Postia placenta MAD-698-R-SB12]|uniref:Uncharacterized protein n=1 Tax=Postia placenta MAD-698-R-SB12 TaxID=670580 RepID=A0A1X6N1B1_9APHY|nr:hypothetical protein POSPLADRAFT_1181516 [Postia placenta MAD-698-R-SB12]OSX62421.1 hypothetical protein POSPLADRAFT_1181516 [Postia placenta MAD-698-R-SB12]
MDEDDMNVDPDPELSQAFYSWLPGMRDSHPDRDVVRWEPTQPPTFVALLDDLKVNRTSQRVSEKHKGLVDQTVSPLSSNSSASSEHRPGASLIRTHSRQTRPRLATAADVSTASTSHIEVDSTEWNRLLRKASTDTLRTARQRVEYMERQAARVRAREETSRPARSGSADHRVPGSASSVPIDPREASASSHTHANQRDTKTASTVSHKHADRQGHGNGSRRKSSMDSRGHSHQRRWSLSSSDSDDDLAAAQQNTTVEMGDLDILSYITPPAAYNAEPSVHFTAVPHSTPIERSRSEGSPNLSPPRRERPPKSSSHKRPSPLAPIVTTTSLSGASSTTKCIPDTRRTSETTNASASTSPTTSAAPRSRVLGMRPISYSVASSTQLTPSQELPTKRKPFKPPFARPPPAAKNTPITPAATPSLPLLQNPAAPSRPPQKIPTRRRSPSPPAEADSSFGDLEMPFTYEEIEKAMSAYD